MSDLSDYEAYLEDGFNAVDFANGLVLSTNNSDDTELDLLTPLKGLNFDLKDLDRKIKQSVDTNYAECIGEFESLDKFAGTVSELEPALKQLNLSYSRLDREILTPYNECNRIHSALKKIHQTSTLLRSSIYFLFLISKIEEIDKTDQGLSKRPFKNVNLLAKLQNQLTLHLADSSYMKSLKLVRDYEEFQPALYTKSLDICCSNFKAFNIDQYDNQSMLNIINSLIYLSPEAFFNQLQQLISSKTTLSVSLISRNLNNVRSLDRIFTEVSKQGKLMSRLDNLMNNNDWVGSKTDDQITDEAIWDAVGPKLDLNSPLVTVFWRDVATGIEPRFKEVMSKGGPTARQLKSSKEDIASSIKRSLLNSFDDSSKKEDRIELTLMLNAIHSLDSYHRG